MEQSNEASRPSRSVRILSSPPRFHNTRPVSTVKSWGGTGEYSGRPADSRGSRLYFSRGGEPSSRDLQQNSQNVYQTLRDGPSRKSQSSPPGERARKDPRIGKRSDSIQIEPYYDRPGRNSRTNALRPSDDVEYPPDRPRRMRHIPTGPAPRQHSEYKIDEYACNYRPRPQRHYEAEELSTVSEEAAETPWSSFRPPVSVTVNIGKRQENTSEEQDTLRIPGDTNRPTKEVAAVRRAEDVLRDHEARKEIARITKRAEQAARQQLDKEIISREAAKALTEDKERKMEIEIRRKIEAENVAREAEIKKSEKLAVLSEQSLTKALEGIIELAREQARHEMQVEKQKALERQAERSWIRSQFKAALDAERGAREQPRWQAEATETTMTEPEEVTVSLHGGPSQPANMQPSSPIDSLSSIQGIQSSREGGFDPMMSGPFHAPTPPLPSDEKTQESFDATTVRNSDQNAFPDTRNGYARQSNKEAPNPPFEYPDLAGMPMDKLVNAIANAVFVRLRETRPQYDASQYASADRFSPSTAQAQRHSSENAPNPPLHFAEAESWYSNQSRAHVYRDYGSPVWPQKSSNSSEVMNGFTHYQICQLLDNQLLKSRKQDPNDNTYQDDNISLEGGASVK